MRDKEWASIILLFPFRLPAGIFRSSAEQPWYLYELTCFYLLFYDPIRRHENVHLLFVQHEKPTVPYVHLRDHM